jgi:hypothetical protein
VCRYAPAFHCHATLASVLGPTLIRNQVRQGRQPGEQCLWAAAEVVQPLHREQLALDSMVGLI